MNPLRDTTTGLVFEENTKINHNGIDISKHKLYQFLKKKDIDWTTILSRKILPDEAFWNEETKELIIYEKKYQKVEGSADEKPQTCGFKIFQFNKIGKALGAKKVKYIYIFNEWFRKDKYKDMLDYIKSINGCDYFFWEDIKDANK